MLNDYSVIHKEHSDRIAQLEQLLSSEVQLLCSQNQYNHLSRSFFFLCSQMECVLAQANTNTLNSVVFEVN